MAKSESSKERMKRLYHQFEPFHIEDEAVRKAVPVLEYLYRRGCNNVEEEREFRAEGEPPSHAQRVGQIWQGMKKRQLPFYFGSRPAVLYPSRNAIIAEELDNIGIGLEVLVHVKLINTCDYFKAGLSAAGYDFVNQR